MSLLTKRPGKWQPQSDGPKGKWGGKWDLQHGERGALRTNPKILVEARRF